MTSLAEAQLAPGRTEPGDEVELSVVMPCLNERATVGTCVKKALGAMKQHGIRGEVIVADNGSTDGSQQIAMENGARVVPIETRGYGSALRGGITTRDDHQSSPPGSEISKVSTPNITDAATAAAAGA